MNEGYINLNCSNCESLSYLSHPGFYIIPLIAALFILIICIILFREVKKKEDLNETGN